jgi:hypothetical protein
MIRTGLPLQGWQVQRLQQVFGVGRRRRADDVRDAMGCQRSAAALAHHGGGHASRPVRDVRESGVDGVGRDEGDQRVLVQLGQCGQQGRLVGQRRDFQQRQTSTTRPSAAMRTASGAACAAGG